jgi:hypothetical protein
MDIVERRMSVEAWIELCAAPGLDAVDLGQPWFRDRRPSTLAALRSRLKCQGLQGRDDPRRAPDFTHPEPQVRRATVDDMRANAGGGPRPARATASDRCETGAGGGRRSVGTAWASEGLTAPSPSPTGPHGRRPGVPRRGVGHDRRRRRLSRRPSRAGLLWRWPISAILRLALAVAALKCRRLGGCAGIPTLAEPRGFLAGRGVELPSIP